MVQIKRAFRHLCLKWHPDLCPPAQARSLCACVTVSCASALYMHCVCAGTNLCLALQRQEAEQTFRSIAEAYAALSGRAQPAPYVLLVFANARV